MTILHLAHCGVHTGGSCNCGVASTRTEAEARAAAAGVPLIEQVACLRREIAMRKNVYRKFVANGRMKQDEADKELAAMQAVHDTLSAAVDALKEILFAQTDEARDTAMASARALLRKINVI